MPVDVELMSFAEIGGPWSGIVLGNGASRAVSGGFAYNSLFAVAQSPSVPNPLVAHEVNIFSQLDTTNFEQVLSALGQARAINEILELACEPISMAYSRIRQALIEAVHAVHIPWAEIPIDTLLSIKSGLRQYQFVYSTNYDLLNYWAMMQDPTGFIDFLFGGTFDVSNTEVWNSTKTRILFLHGALHLYRTTSGTVKRISGLGNLLESFGEPLEDNPTPIPLFISEGTSHDKLSSIHSSDYLGFAYNELVNHSGGLVILGQSLDPEYDQHLIDAIRGRRGRRLGIGIYRGSKADAEVMAEKVAWLQKFDGRNFSIEFFDSSTHPLSTTDLSVT